MCWHFRKTSSHAPCTTSADSPGKVSPIWQHPCWPEKTTARMPRGRKHLANQERVSRRVTALLQDDTETATIKVEGNFAQAHPLRLHLLLCLPLNITLNAVVHNIPLSSLHRTGPFCFTQNGLYSVLQAVALSTMNRATKLKWRLQQCDLSLLFLHAVYICIPAWSWHQDEETKELRYCHQKTCPGRQGNLKDRIGVAELQALQAWLKLSIQGLHKNDFVISEGSRFVDA